jgi:hypothetical protein
MTRALVLRWTSAYDRTSRGGKPRVIEAGPASSSWILVDSYLGLIEDLAVAHRASGALTRLMRAGTVATLFLCRGLRHDNPAVRIGCCIVLDHFLDEAAVPELIANLTHADNEVRAWALHALACDRCKQGACRPGEDMVIPIALRMLQDDPSPRVRHEVAHLLGRNAHRRADICRALEDARDHDPDPGTRKIAGWYAPRGPIYRRLASTPVRDRRRQPLHRPRPGTQLYR